MKPATGRLTLASTSTDTGLFRAELLQRLGDQADAYPIEIERLFPHVVARMVRLWGTQHFDAYLQSLIVSDLATRGGFPAEVIMEIYGIYETHAARRPVAGLGSTTYRQPVRRDLDYWR